MLLKLSSCWCFSSHLRACYYDPQLVISCWHVEVPALSNVGPWANFQWLQSLLFVHTDTSRSKLLKIRKERAVHPWGCVSEIQPIKEIACRNQVAKLNRKPKGAMPQNVDQLAMDFAKLTMALDVSFS